MSDAWRAFGRLPAAPVLGVFFGVQLVVAIALGGDVPPALIALWFAALAAYCLARPTRGWDVLGAALLPGLAGALLGAAAGTPRWLGAALIPVAVLLVRDADREVAA